MISSPIAAGDQSAYASLKKESLNLKQVIEEMFLVLTDKEKDVITKRFSLNNQPRQTLERIGKQFSVTRERIRQIENIALGKLRRNVGNTKLRIINKLGKDILRARGGLMLETSIISEVLNQIHTASPIDGSIIKLSLSIDNELKKCERTSIFEPFWHFKEITLPEIKIIVEACIKVLEKRKTVIVDDKITSEIQNLNLFKDKKATNELITACMTIDKRMRKIEEGWGLMSWRNVNPRSIRDKAEIVLKKSKKPLHFVDIANRIGEIGFDRKIVTVQAVHNELIRYPQFVLIGRGLYALSEWGYKPGTVADVIESLLKENKEPMSKKDIVDGVNKQRKVKLGTISLNLQKNPQFIRVGRAVYKLDENKKKK